MSDAKKLITRISQYNNTQAGWYMNNPILAAGELGIEIDTNRVKVGDGTHHWNELPYWTNGGVTYTAGAGITIDTETQIITPTLQFREINI